MNIKKCACQTDLQIIITIKIIDQWIKARYNGRLIQQNGEKYILFEKKMM